MAWPPPLPHGAWIEVDLDALVGNARLLREVLPATARLGIAVKANGYGHGLVMAARAALRGGADLLLVATVGEGLALRRAGVAAPVMVIYPAPAASVGDAAVAGLELSVSGLASARETLAAWRRAHGAADPVAGLRLHVELETGMGRGGVPGADLPAVLTLVAAAPGATVASLWTHLSDGSDEERSAEQSRRFDLGAEATASAGRADAIPAAPEAAVARHIAATDGLLAASVPVHDLVRVGLAFYGELEADTIVAPVMTATAAALRPALTLKARPVRVEDLPRGASAGYGREWTAERDSRVATLPIGYADGWSRSSWPGTWALVRGRRVPLVGRISMDSCGVDVTDAGPVGLDDEFVLLGAQGDERIAVAEVARVRGTISHEVLAILGPRLPRVYLAAGRPVAIALEDHRVEVGPEAALP